MQNLLDYLEWRGDLSFAADPFNEIDSLILSVIVMSEFEGLVPASFTEAVSFGAACNACRTQSGKHLGAVIPDSLLEVPEKAAACPRFQSMTLCGYVNEVDEAAHKQFAALTFRLPGEQGFCIAYRGTDDTLVGWKEDLELSFLAPVPAQTRAAEYLEEAAAALPGPIRLCGHSKGGNLTVYAGAHVSPETQKRIRQICNNDGPGMLPDALQESGCRAVEDRIITFVPQSSIVGATLHQAGTTRYIRSRQVGVMQHDPMSWEVLGARFLYEEERSLFGRRVDETINPWIATMTMEERQWMTETLFGIVDSAGVHTLTELTENRIRTLGVLFQAYREMPQESKEMLHRLLSRLFHLNDGNEQKQLPEQLQKLWERLDFTGKAREGQNEKLLKDFWQRMRREPGSRSEAQEVSEPELPPSPTQFRDVEEVLEIALGKQSMQ